NEIGIRMALGAQRTRLLRMVLTEVAMLILTGLAIGLAGAISGTRFLGSFLYDVKPNDPKILAAACIILAVTAIAGGFLPARRAANLDPMTALRED
ncbi:MAG TPA: FtsX-like permease family protein, partial [Bryobacteraceae bacterium]